MNNWLPKSPDLPCSGKPTTVAVLATKWVVTRYTRCVCSMNCCVGVWYYCNAEGQSETYTPHAQGIGLVLCSKTVFLSYSPRTNVNSSPTEITKDNCRYFTHPIV